MKILDIDIIYYVFSILIIYIPLHFLEEALGRFHETMYLHKWIPEKISYGHWMANNVFFYLPVLQIGFITFFFKREFLFIGIGILFWGIINLIDHLIYTIIDRKRSPGIYTGILFALASIAGIISISNKLTTVTIILSLILAIIYIFFPILLSVIFHKRFKDIFI